MSNLLLVPLEDLVVFPNMSVTLTIDVPAYVGTSATTMMSWAGSRTPYR